MGAGAGQDAVHIDREHPFPDIALRHAADQISLALGGLHIQIGLGEFHDVCLVAELLQDLDHLSRTAAR